MKTLMSFILRSLLKENQYNGIVFNKRIIYVTIRISVIILAITFLHGCSYFMVTSTAYPKAEEITPFLNNNKIFVLHTDQKAFVINKFKIVNDSIKGNYAYDYVFPYIGNTFPKVNSTHRYQRRDYRVTNEVHIWVPSPQYSEDKTNSYALKDIYRFDIYSHDKGATTFSWVFSIIGGIFALPILFFLGMLVIMIVAGSCPYIYVNNGEEFVLAGDIFSGAVYAPLERNDYLNLPQLVAEDAKYLLKISNELEEVQYNNLTELLVIDHPVTSKILIDKYGNYQTNTDIRQPLSAINITGTDIRKIIKDKDSLSYFGPLPVGDIPSVDNMILTFDLPEGVSKAKLFIRAKNSPWLENVYKDINRLLGSYEKKWSEKQNKADAMKLQKGMLNQNIPLSVYIEKNGDWVFCDFYNLIGPLSMKDDVIEIDLRGISKGPLKIKLESGAYFWNIDYAGIDFSDNVPVNITVVKLEKAVTEKEDLVTDLLKFDDLKYYVQDLPFNSAELSFSVPEVNGDQRTVILHSKGYYQMNHDGKGLPKIRKLKSIRQPGQFPEYSREMLRSAYEKSINR